MNTINPGKTLGFPFAVTRAGFINATGGDEALRGKIIQVLFTAPGERVNLPEFGCGLFNLVFEPLNDILAAAMEFTVNRALVRWLGDEIIVQGVEVERSAETVGIEIVYQKKQDLSKQTVQIQFK